MINVNWSNPYAGASGRWLKGNLHTHTSPSSGCSVVAPADMLAMYEKAGYDFLSLSDHMSMIDAPATRLTLIPGIEWNSSTGEHAGVYSLNPKYPRSAIDISDQRLLLERHGNVDALLILNHPDWQLTPHYRREALLERKGYDGIEIYNGVIERLQGYPISTDKWDFLLVQGRRVLGFASDDSHADGDVARGWMMVQTNDVSASAIMHALQCGQFYCSTGASIASICREGNTITIDAPEAQEIRSYGNGGVNFSRVMGSHMQFSFAEFAAEYVRFQVYGEGAAQAWSQPLFMNG